MIFCAGKTELFDFAVPIGIGMVESAINLTRFLEKNPCKEVVFIGSAGSYGEIKIGAIVESSKASNVESSSLKSESYSPIPHTVNKPFVSRETFTNSSNYITASKKDAELFLASGLQIENMEFYGVAKTAEIFNIPFRGIFVITNYCDSSAHESYKNNYKEAMKNLTHYLKENGYI